MFSREPGGRGRLRRCSGEPAAPGSERRRVGARALAPPGGRAARRGRLLGRATRSPSPPRPSRSCSRSRGRRPPCGAPSRSSPSSVSWRSPTRRRAASPPRTACASSCAGCSARAVSGSDEMRELAACVEAGDPRRCCSAASRLLSERTRQLGFVVVPRLGDVELRHVSLVRLSTRARARGARHAGGRDAAPRARGSGAAATRRSSTAWRRCSPRAWPAARSREARGAPGARVAQRSAPRPTGCRERALRLAREALAGARGRGGPA